MDEIDPADEANRILREMNRLVRLAHWMLENPELATATTEALAEGPRYSPAARRFMSGRMKPEEARRLGFTR